MRRFQAVTTFNAAGHDLYGRRMVETFDALWDAAVPLTVWREGFDFTPAWRVRSADLASVAWLNDFKARHLTNRAAHGRKCPTYNFRMDAVRFAHKTAAVISSGLAAIEHNTADVLIWIDGDTVTHSPVTTGFLERLLPESAAIAWLDRDGLYPECGFYLLNLKHPDMGAILRFWRSLYTSDRVFKMAEWHDSYVLQQVIAGAMVTTHSLSGPARSTMHPFVNSALGSVMDHCKGPRKATGRSKPTDIKTNRPEAYWR